MVAVAAALCETVFLSTACPTIQVAGIKFRTRQGLFCGLT